MNLASPWHAPSKFLFRIAMKCRRLLPKRRCQAFGTLNTKELPRIEHIYVINLEREPARWAQMEQELRQVLDFSGAELWNLTERYSAIDANSFTKEPLKDAAIDPTYTLGDQLFVEPQPLSFPTRLELTSPIRMSRPEIAVALSHINVWKQVSARRHDYVLILEDDVWFESAFCSELDQAWGEIKAQTDGRSNFDILYVSYAEVKHGAPKTFLSKNVYCPVRGLWHLSGYILSREGAKKLIRLLPCRGPVDLWINHQFQALDVRATRRSIVRQRRDVSSTNTYSILPALTKIGAITSEAAALFHGRPTQKPVFAFGPENSGLTSLAMALSMLGYRCCSDLQEIPGREFEHLLATKTDRVFDAYVNIRALEGSVQELRKAYPKAKFIITTDKSGTEHYSHLKIVGNLKGADVAVLSPEAPNKWQVICEHLNCAPPACSFPDLTDRGHRQLLARTIEVRPGQRRKTPKRDKSPWIVEFRKSWQGIPSVPISWNGPSISTTVVKDSLEVLDTRRWFVRDDTFTDNLALFRPSNIEFSSGSGAELSVRMESLGVREYSAAAFTSRERYLFGRFEAIIRASNVPGVITGFFLHRDSPRQEIDIEITGKRTNRLLVNVFYNPGGEGAKFDYGYRGAASYINLGFDASQSYHRFAIEWGPSAIHWLVDDHLVHSRAEWDPTPIPHLPMAVHVNTWPSRSKELAGRLVNRRLPATSFVKSISLQAHRAQ